MVGEQSELRYRRGQARAGVVTYRLRAELNETDPPAWRRIEVSSELNLAELHDVLQVAFGWTDSHLHGFVAGPEFYHGGGERYLCPIDEELDNFDGVPEAQVRLDEVLAEAGDTLSYAYDYGDNWQALVTLEAVLARPGDSRNAPTPRAICTDGDRPGPAEDCGGVRDYELIALAADPAQPGHASAQLEFARTFGEEISPGNIPMTPFDRDQINGALQQLGPNPRVDVDALPVALRELFQALTSPDGLRTTRQLIAAAELDRPVEVDVETARRMVHPYSWLLDRVGADGIKLTGAGYLPPVHVSAAFDELGLAEEWPGRGFRESDTIPVLHLRESAQKLGLLRKYRGELRCTARGLALREDPIGLWRHLAERMAVGSSDPFSWHAELLYLLVVAANCAGDRDETVARILATMWKLQDGSPPDSYQAFMAGRGTRDVLTRIGAITGSRITLRSKEKASPEGTLFARAALITWPD